jgi:hypothetical protein
MGTPGAVAGSSSAQPVGSESHLAKAFLKAHWSEKGVRLAQKMHVGPCIAARIHL